MRIRTQIVVLAVMTAPWWATPASAQFQVEPAFPNLSFSNPVDLQHAGDGTDRLFVVEQSGVIRVFDNDPAANAAPVFLDIQERVSSGGERGLLGMAFDPDFAANGFFYVNYTAPSPLRSVVSRFELEAGNPDQGDPDSELILLEVGQPADNHNGGQLAFGPDDGYLYVALGDGGGSGDPGENGQDPTTLLGALLRLDVAAGGGGLRPGGSDPPDCGAGPNANYAIPPGNPLADGPGNTCDEIWAYGLRNPWRASFDAVTGWLWAADVGQGDYEEVDVVEPGGNYGWNTMEGFHCFDPPMGCDQTGLALPVWEYPHNGQSKSVTGGYVYRGAGVPELTGRYVYADFIDGRIWALDYDGQQAVNTLLIDTDLNLSSFGVDEAGELYLVDLGGTLYRFTPTAAFLLTLKRVFVKPTGKQKAVVKWNSADVATAKIDFYVAEDPALPAPDGSPDTRTANDGKTKLTIPIGNGGPRYNVRACEKKSTTLCSNVVAADFTGAATIDETDPDFYDDDDEAGKAGEAAPDAFARYGNYPNPFNPRTTIRFVLPEAGAVRLEVFDLLGRRVAVLVDAPRAAGVHEAVFEAGALPGGVYLYRLQAGAAVRMGRMTLLR